jgi:hypothetical protein
MHTFQRRARHQRILSRDLEQRRRFHYQEWSQAFAAAEARVAHSAEKPHRPSLLAIEGTGRKQAIEQRFRVVGNLTEPVLKGRFDVDTFFLRRINAGHAFRPPSAYSTTSDLASNAC